MSKSQKPKSYKDFRVWCPLADLWLDDLEPFHRDYLSFIFSYLKDNDARKLALYLRTWDEFDNVFWNPANNLYYLDSRVYELIEIFASGVVMVFTGLVGSTGVGKSWSAISLAMRYAHVFDGLFELDTLFMDETELRDVKGGKAFNILDDPSFSRTGEGIQRIRDTLESFTRRSSRKAQASLFACSAIDVFNNRKLRLDGVHFFIEMWGYNRADGRALGMLYDNDLSPLGWVFIPSPIRREIRYYSPNDESYHTTNLRDFKVGTEYDEQSDSMKEIYVSPFEFVMEFYERGKKEDFVERLMSQSSKASWFQFCDVIEAHEDFPAYCTSKTNLETLVARELPSLTGEERKRIATELYIKQQERELTESITSITGKYFIDSDKFEFNLETFLEDLSLSKSWRDKVKVYRWNVIEEISQDDIREKWIKEGNPKFSQMTFSNWKREVEGEVARVMGITYEEFLFKQYQEDIEGVLDVQKLAGQSDPDIIVEYTDGRIDVISVKCYNYKRKRLSIPIHELEPEIIRCRRLLRQGEENVYLVLELYNLYTKQRIRKIIAHNNLESLPHTISLKLKEKDL